MSMVETEGNEMATTLQLKVDEFTKFLVERNGYSYATGSLSTVLSMAANRTEQQLIETMDVVMKFMREGDELERTSKIPA